MAVPKIIRNFARNFFRGACGLVSGIEGRTFFVNPLKQNKNYGTGQKKSQCAVYAFRHAILRLPDYGKRIGNKAIVIRTD